MVETPANSRMRYDELPCRVQAIIKGIHEQHRLSKQEKLLSRREKSLEVKNSLREQYAKLIEEMRDFKPTENVTHFRLSKTGDVVFVTNSKLYGQSFKRLWNLHLPLC